HAAVEAAQDGSHKIERAIIPEIGSVNGCAIHFRREKTGASDIPHVVRGRGRVRQRRSSRKPGAAQASHAKMFQSGRRTKDRVASAVKRRDAIGEISHSAAIVVIWCASIE